jgi:hypothetical protein
MIRRTWTDADDARLRAMIAKDTPSDEIAALLKRSAGACSKRMTALGIRRSAGHSRNARAARLAMALADPAVRQRQKLNAALSWKGADDRRAAQSERARQNLTMMHCNRTLKATPELERQRIAKMRASMLKRNALKLAWCPEALRGEYRRLMRYVGAADAKRMLLEQIARDDRLAQAKMAPFERELHRVNTGQSRVIVLPPRPAPMQEGRRA